MRTRVGSVVGLPGSVVMDTFDIVRQTDALISADPLRSVGLGGAGGLLGA